MPKRKKIPTWEWITASAITILAGVIIWTNEGVDLFIKFGIPINPKWSVVIFMIIMAIGLGWLLNLYSRKILR